MGWVEPTSYAQGYMCGRFDATPNNGLGMKMESDGRVTVQVINGGTANARTVSSYQSLPLNKKTHVAASWAAGVVVIYFDGVSVPVSAAVTGGTAPTTAGTGGDFSIGRPGAYNAQYFSGYLSGFGVFDAVLTAATIRSLMSQDIAVGATNCIGSWNLNNTGVNQQAAGTNDLTATNSVSYTLRSPYATQADGTNNGTTEYAIITKTAFSTNTTLTVQVPEGNAIPTSGGVLTVSYSTQKVPYGFPAARGKWRVKTLLTTIQNSGSIAQNAYSNIASFQINAPVGDGMIGYEVQLQVNPSSGVTGTITSALSTSASSFSDVELIGNVNSSGSTLGAIAATVSVTRDVNNTTATTYYFVSRNESPVNATLYHNTALSISSRLFWEPAYL